MILRNDKNQEMAASIIDIIPKLSKSLSQGHNTEVVQEIPEECIREADVLVDILFNGYVSVTINSMKR